MNEATVSERLPRLLERSDAICAIDAALSAARRRRVSVLFVVGEAGLGKSALLDHAQATSDGFVVARASGEATETVLPFGVMDCALARAGAEDLLRAAPELPVSERAAAAWYRLQQWLSDQTEPLLLAIDDLHFADTDSLNLLALLSRRISVGRIAVVATLRPWPPDARRFAEQLVQAGAARVNRLAPLSPAASVALVTRLTGQSQPPVVTDQIAMLCAGNPALLKEVANCLRRDPTVSSPSLGANPRRLLLGRFTGLEVTSLEYARTAAIFGVQFRPALAGLLAGIDEQQTRAALRALCEAGLVGNSSDSQACFTHALLHQALYDDIPLPFRTQLHGGAFRLMWDCGLPASQAAIHALAGDLVGDETAIEALEAAGAGALSHGATGAAARWLRGARYLSGTRPSAELAVRLADGLCAAGEPAEAVELCRLALGNPRSRRPTKAAAYRSLARALVVLGETHQAEDAFESAVEEAQVDQPILAAEALLEASLVALYMSGPARASQFAQRAISLLRGDCDSQLASWAQAALGMARLMQAQIDGAHQITEALARLSPISGLRGLRGATEWGPLLQQLQTHKFLERFDDAIADYRRAVDESGEAMTPMARSIYDVVHADTLSRLGRLVEARDALLRAEEVVEFAPAGGVWTWVGLAHVNLEIGASDKADRYCRQVEQVVGLQGESLPTLRFWLWRVRAVLALERDDPEAACTLMSYAEALADKVAAYEPSMAIWHPVAVAAYIAAGRLSEAERVIESLCAAGEVLGTRFPMAVASRGRAQLAERAGEPDSAASHFSAAMRWHQELTMPLEEIETLLAYGGFLRRHKSPTAARPILARAGRLAASCNAGRLEERSKLELRMAGGRRRSRYPIEGSLTPVEQRVVDLAAQGKTNIEIGRQLMISARTVEHHLTRIYAELRITSRRQLPRS